MSTPFLEAALIMLKRGWLCMPLTNDQAGYPKRPIVTAWSSLERSEETIRSLPWHQAKGLGIVLGAASSGLGVLDIDDEELAPALIIALGYTIPPRWVRTARNRGHIYVQQQDPPSPSTRFQIQWHDREITIELKSNGTQVAAPPSPGYALVPNCGAPLDAFDMVTAWEFVKDCFDDFLPGQLQAKASEGGAAGYPRPWNEEVPKEKRNNTLYIEAHKLREAGMPYDQAVALLTSRVESSYSPGDFGYQEIERTIQSAYTKGVPTSFYDEDDDELKLLGRN